MDNKYIDVVPDQPIAEGYNSDERELDVPDFPQGEQKVKTVKVEVEDIESGEKVEKKLGEYQGELSPNPGYGEDGETKDATKIHLVEETVPVDGGTFADQPGIRVEREPVNFVGGLLIKGKTVEDYVDSEGGVTEEELTAKLSEYTKKTEVAAQLVGKDVKVEGITSKGIANTGNIANTGDIATTGKITGGEIIENMSGYSFIERPKSNITNEVVYAGIVKNGNKLTLVTFGKLTRTGEVANNFMELGDLVIPKEVANKIYPTPLGSQTNAVCSKVINLFASSNNSTPTNLLVNKDTNSGKDVLRQFIYNVNSLTLNTEYQYRVELTFLLSENLASEN